MGQRFLTIYMLAQGDGSGCDNGVSMVGSGYHHGVDALAYLVEHLAPVLVALGVGKVVEGLHGIAPVYIAEGYDILRLEVFHVAAPHSAHADAGDVELVARGRESVSLAQHIRRHDGDGRSAQQALPDKLSSRNAIHDSIKFNDLFFY